MIGQSRFLSALRTAFALGIAFAPVALAAQESVAATGSDSTQVATAPAAVSTPAPPVVADSAAPASIGPRLAPVALQHRADRADVNANTDGEAHLGAGRNLALMGVGLAGLIVGLVVGGGAGTAIAVGGGLVGLYGLYKFLQ
jgi:hypothetical protein